MKILSKCMLVVFLLTMTFSCSIQKKVKAAHGGMMIMLDESDGSQTITGSGKFNPISKKADALPKDSSGFTPETPVWVYTVPKSAYVRDVLLSFSDDLDSLCLTESQIVQFVSGFPELVDEERGASFITKGEYEYLLAMVSRTDTEKTFRMELFSIVEGNYYFLEAFDIVIPKNVK